MTAHAKLTCVVVDDNETNRLTLEHFIGLTPELTLLASFASTVDCLAYLRHGARVDVAFVDVEMPLLSGLDLVRILPAPQPDIVMVTSHRSFARHAFDLQVTDYVVKPVALPRFLQAVERVLQRRQLAAAAPPLATAEAGPQGKHLFVKVNKKLVRINFEDVLYIEALSDYSVVVMDTQRLIVYNTLKSLEKRLPLQFARVHRSYLVNTRRIDAVEDHTINFGKHEVPIGKSYQDDFYRRLRAL